MTYFRKILTIAALLVCAATAGAADFFSGLGVRTSMEVTIPSGGRGFYGNGAGFTAGVSYTVPIAGNFSFDPELLFVYSTMSDKSEVMVDDHYYNGAARTFGLRVPLMFSYNFSLHRNVTMAVSTGPWLNINLSARQNLLPNMEAPVAVPAQKTNLFDQGWKRFDAQWGLKLSFTFAESYFVGITTGVAFTPLASFGDKDKKIRIHRNTIAISLGYNF